MRKLRINECKLNHPDVDYLPDGQELDWEVYLKETASLIVKEQSPRRLLEVS